MRRSGWSCALALMAGCAGTSPPVTPACPDEEPPAVESRVMGRATYRAFSDDTEGLGGFARSENRPRPWTGGPREGVVVLVEPLTRLEQEGRIGMRVVVLNGTDARLGFSAQDSLLSLIQEARDPETGEWRPIEYMPGSWCGNSYHTLFLPPGACWELPAPRYAGPIHTELRFRLSGVGVGDDGGGGREVTSAPFRGGVHREQFTDKEGHTPTDLMDPYRD